MQNSARAGAAPPSLYTDPPGCTGLAQEPPTQGVTLPGRCRGPEPASQRRDLAPAGASEHRYGQDLFFLLKHIRLQISGGSARREPRYHQMTLLCQPTAIPRSKQHPALQAAPGSSGINVLRSKQINPGAGGTLTRKLFVCLSSQAERKNNT